MVEQVVRVVSAIERKLVLGVIYLTFCTGITVVEIFKAPSGADFLGLSSVFASMAMGMASLMFGFKAQYDADAKKAIGVSESDNRMPGTTGDVAK